MLTLGILGWRQKGWEAVSARRHICQGVFAGKASNEVMMFGTVDYDMKDGTSKNGIEWAAHLVTDGQDDPKIKFYQVYIVSARREVVMSVEGLEVVEVVLMADPEVD